MKEWLIYKDCGCEFSSDEAKAYMILPSQCIEREGECPCCQSINLMLKEVDLAFLER